jgi:hypothetical protein
MILGVAVGSGLLPTRFIRADEGPDGSGALRGGAAGDDGSARRTSRGGGNETAAMGGDGIGATGATNSRQVLDCGSPLPFSHQARNRWLDAGPQYWMNTCSQGGRGLPHSKTLSLGSDHQAGLGRSLAEHLLSPPNSLPRRSTRNAKKLLLFLCGPCAPSRQKSSLLAKTVSDIRALRRFWP